MSVKGLAAIVAVGERQDLNVAEICRSEGISVKTFYKYVAPLTLPWVAE